MVDATRGHGMRVRLRSMIGGVGHCGPPSEYAEDVRCSGVDAVRVMRSGVQV